MAKNSKTRAEVQELLAFFRSRNSRIGLLQSSCLSQQKIFLSQYHSFILYKVLKTSNFLLSLPFILYKVLKISNSLLSLPFILYKVLKISNSLLSLPFILYKVLKISNSLLSLPFILYKVLKISNFLLSLPFILYKVLKASTSLLSLLKNYFYSYDKLTKRHRIIKCSGRKKQLGLGSSISVR